MHAAGVDPEYCLCCCVAGLYSAQSPEPPISQGTCDALKSIAAGTAGSFIAECTVEEGCGTLDCENQATGSSILTVRPCSDPPFIEVEFYNTSDALLLVQNLTGNHTIPFGSNALIFSVAQLSGAIGLKASQSYTDVQCLQSLMINSLSVLCHNLL